MKRKSNQYKHKDTLIILVWLLVFALYFSYLFSGLGLIISGKIGLSAQKIGCATGRCVDVNIDTMLFPMPARYVEPAEMKIYDFTLDNGLVYSTQGYYLERNGITDARLHALKGTEITIEYSEARFLSASYTILSVSNADESVIPLGLVIPQIEKYWKYTRNTLAIAFGISIGILLLCVIPMIRKKVRKGRKKARRTQQLLRRRQREEQTLQNRTGEAGAPNENRQGDGKQP